MNAPALPAIQPGDKVFVYSGKNYGRAHKVLSLPRPGYVCAEYGPTGEVVTVHQSDVERAKS